MRDDPSALLGNHSDYVTPNWLGHVRRKSFIGEPTSLLEPGTICISDLSFRYSDHLPLVFRNLNLKLGAGEMVSFVGPRGCGKTTLMQLIQGLQRPTRGVVLACGRKDRHDRLHDARVAVVPREAMLFGGSVLGNLIMADPLADFGRITRACHRAGVHDLVMSLPAGYETDIGEAGMGLAPGPRQCLSLARALLRDPDILIVDDGFAQCCPEWAMHLAHALNGLKDMITVLVAGHRVQPGLALDAVYNLGRDVPTKLVVMNGGAMPARMGEARLHESVTY